MHSIDISVVIPTRNERENIEPLIARLAASLPAGTSQVIFVDDSSDDTPLVMAAIAETSTLPVLILHREPGERTGGLGGAVVAGLRLCEGRVAVVMDGDLQHPPETIPDLIRPIDLGEADVVVASRYRDNGQAAGLANKSRVGVSHAATKLTNHFDKMNSIEPEAEKEAERIKYLSYYSVMQHRHNDHVLAVINAEAYRESRESLGFPLLQNAVAQRVA